MSIKRSADVIAKDLVKVNEYAAGIDIGSKSHYIAIPPSMSKENVREYKGFTSDLNEAVKWLKSYNITTVAMESTGVYWISFYDILEQNGIEVYLVNAKHVKTVPGRKSDVLDCQWLQKLHSYGLLRGSFIPGEDIRVLRGYMRHREMLVWNISKQVNLMQKNLSQMNIQIHNVLSDITGVSGQKILRSIIAGERDAKILAGYRDSGCKSSVEIIEKSLEGNYRIEHVFGLKQAFESYDFYHTQLKACDTEIEKTLNVLDYKEGLIRDKSSDKVVSRKRRKNELHFDAQTEIINMTGVDLTQIDGVSAYSAFKILTEIGTDMSRWPTVKHFISWLGLAPGTKISGGKRLSSATKHCVNRVATTFRVAAQSLSRSHSSLGAFLRRKKAQLGSPKAITATAHKIAKIFYLMLKHGTEYIDLGEQYYEKKYKEKIEKNLKRRAQMLGFDLIKKVDISDTCVRVH